MRPLSVKEEIAHDNAKSCHVCKKVFGAKKNHVKVRDQDHYTGQCNGAAHLICNLRYSTPIDIPVFFHDGTNYDFNLKMNELAKEFRSEMRCRPLNTNKCMSFSIPIKIEVKKEHKEQKRTEEKSDYLQFKIY